MRKALLSIGITFHIIYFVFAILSLNDYDYAGYGVGKAFAFWIYAMLVSFLVIIIYLIEAIKTFAKSKKAFNAFKLIAIILLIPLCVFVGCSAGVVQSAIWNIYFFTIFVIQIISLFVKQIDG